MVEIGTVLTPVGKKALLCGSGELGKEVAIELQRYGVEVVALDKYANAPAMQVAHRSHVLSMLDGKKLREIIEEERPDYIIPEVEAIATDTLVALEKEGYSVTPHRYGGLPHDEPGGNPSAGSRTTGIAYLALQVCIDPRGVRGRRSGDWYALRGKTHHEFVGSRTERGTYRRRY